MTSGHRRLNRLSINLEYLNVFFLSLFIILVSQSRESEAQTCSFLPIALPSFPLVSPLKKTLLYTPPFPHADGLESRKCYIEVGRRNRRRSSTSLSLRHIPDILQAMPLLLSLSFSLYLFLSATSRMLFKNASCKNLPVLRPLVITKAFFFIVFYSLFLSLPAPAPSS